MKTLIKAALAATAATALFASPAFAQVVPPPYVPVKATADFTAKAKIVKPLTLANSVALDFGTILMKSGLVSSTVRVGRTGGTLPSSCDALVLTCSGTQTAALFTATGVANQTLVVAVDTSVNKLTSGSNTVDFAADAPSTVLLDSNGTIDFDIGGTVTVKDVTVDGNYSAAVPVTVTYQ